MRLQSLTKTFEKTFCESLDFPESILKRCENLDDFLIVWFEKSVYGLFQQYTQNYNFSLKMFVSKTYPEIGKLSLTQKIVKRQSLQSVLYSTLSLQRT
jgi:hypothetical protein